MQFCLIFTIIYINIESQNCVKVNLFKPKLYIAKCHDLFTLNILLKTLNDGKCIPKIIASSFAKSECLNRNIFSFEFRRLCQQLNLREGKFLNLIS